MLELLRRLIERHIRQLIAPRPGAWVLASILLTVLSVGVIAARWNINSDFKALLPAHSQAARAMDEVDQRVGGGSSLFVVIDSPDRAKNIAFAKAYSEELLKRDGVALAHYHNDKSFFEDRQLLYMEVEDLQKLRERLKGRIREAKKRANPFYISLDDPKDKKDGDKDDVAALQKKYDDRLAHNSYKEYLTSDDGYALVVIVRFVESSTNLVATNKLIDEVRQIARDLKPETFHPELRVEFGGGLARRQEQYRSIVEDIQHSAVFTVLGIFLLIGLYFRRVRAVGIVLIPLLMSVLWTLAVAFGAFGELTAITIFIFAILLGLGIDYGIHLLNGYDQHRAEGAEPVEALVGCFLNTGKATVTGALTTFVTFLVLSFAQFRGLSQFGMVASIGVLATLASMLVTLPALILLFQRWRPVEVTPSHPEPASTEALQRTLNRLAPVAGALVVLLSIGAAIYAPKLQFEETWRDVGKINWPWQPAEAVKEQRDLIRWRARRAAEHVSLQAELVRKRLDPKSYVPSRRQKTIGQKYVNATRGQQSSMPTILLFDDTESLRVVQRRFQKDMAAGELDTVRAANSIWAFMPGTLDEQKARAAELVKIKEMLDEEPTRFLSKKERDQLEKLKPQLDAKPFGLHELPLWTKRLFKEAGPRAHEAAGGEPFAYEYLLYITERINQMDGPQARAYLKDIEGVREQTHATFRVGSQAYIYTAMLDEIRHDGSRMMGIALVLVLILLIAAFRHPGRAIMSMLPLIVGVFWMTGMCAWLGIKLDFFNMIILPAILGIGVDDGVHFTMHYLDGGRGSLPNAVRHVGSAIIMTSITSIIGFGGLAVTNYRGLQSIGNVAIVGILCTLLATLLVLPPLIVLMERLSPIPPSPLAPGDLG